MVSLDAIIFDMNLIVFDFDGVLVDSNNVKADAFAEIYHECGESIVSQIRNHHFENGGMSRFKKFQHYHEYFLGEKINIEKLETLAAKFSELVVENVISADWVSGAEQFLEKLNRLQIKCVINSATPQDELRLIVKRRGMSHLFSDVFGSPATKVENLRKIIGRYSVNPSQVTFFGDALSDWEAAHTVKIPFVGVGADIRKVSSRCAGNDFFIDNFDVFEKSFRD